MPCYAARMLFRRSARASLILSLLLGFSGIALQGRVVRLETLSQQPVLEGRSFGAAGAYERVAGKAYFAVEVTHAGNRRIVDLEKAVNLKNGMVAFEADFVVIQPKDPQRGNGSLLLEVPNRGKSRLVGLVDGGDWNLAHDAGDAWLLRRGYSIAAVGWQWDATGPNTLHLFAPIARESGQTIHGLLRGDFMPSHDMDEVPLGHFMTGEIGGTEYPVSDATDSRNQLTVRDSRQATRSLVPRGSWRFAHKVNGKLVDSNRFIYLDSGFRKGKLYEYVYAVADPVVAGLGFAAIRDFASYAKWGDATLHRAARIYGEGISQNGRFLRDYLYQGFNTDESGRMVLDGVLAHVAGAGRGSFNYRFAQPSRDAQPTSSIYFPTDIFPFTDEPENDTAEHQRAGLLDSAKTRGSVPKIFFSNTSYEYWGRAAALIHSTADGTGDMPIAPNVRIYHFTGLQHFPGPFPPAAGTADLHGQQAESPLPIRYFWRAMITNMDAWVRSGKAPPESSYPKIAEANLVPISEYAFPAIPHVHRPYEASQAYRISFGPDWQKGILAWQPPKVGAPFATLVPQVDRDGNERDGVRLPAIQVPLATYTGWNLRDPAIGAERERVAFEGSYLPFPKTRAERQTAHDPRPSIEERYKDRSDYMERYRKAVDKLVQDRWILEEDRAALLQRGELEWDAATR